MKGKVLVYILLILIYNCFAIKNSLNKIKKFIFVKNYSELTSLKCKMDSDCKDCDISFFTKRCHEDTCYCCNNEKKCWCQK